jgi:SAM-dependent methyltransferase
MDEYCASTYGERIAGIYDDLYSDYDEATIEVLQELAKGGPALELGIGTGRIALPLKAKGVEMHGVDASPAMIEKLRAKPGGEEVPVTVGDFGEVSVEGEYTLIYVVFNTFYALLTQEAQINCFRNVANHLDRDGVFLIEVFVPDMTRFTNHQTVRVINMDENRVQLDVNRHDPVKQQVMSQHIRLSEKGIELYPVKVRYAWPSELDLMARLAGLKLQHRWGDWNRSPFTAESGRHISVYIRQDEANR